jgi:hypothetical protein
MIALFRKIRQKLVESGSFSRYILYATGEIMLVMIGILLALQVNNWNETRKRLNQEEYLTLELKKELEDNLVLINEDIESNRTGLNGTLEFLRLLQERGLENKKQKADSLIVYFFLINTVDPVSGVIDDMINTGKLDLIRDDSLRKALSNWGGRNADLYDDIEIRNNYLFNSIVPFISKYYPLIDTRTHYGDVSLTSPVWKELVDSKDSVDLNKMYSKEMEGHAYNHALNQEYVITGSEIYRDYIKNLLSKLDKQLEVQK